METLNEVVQIKVNESRLVQNLGTVFSSNTKVLAELMQNARRAGATRINIVENGDVLTISDNGSGISDFQKLLTLAESGWDAQTVESEGAYGMGFFSALFSAKKVIVQSNGKQIIIHCDEDLLTQKIDILASSVVAGTFVHLHGCQVSDIRSVLESYCAGFAVDVYLNGDEKPIPSPHRLNGEFDDFGAGKIRGPLLRFKKATGYSHSKNYVAYLQGFAIAANYGYGHDRIDPNATVIHLSNKDFAARMPDRDALINHVDAEMRIMDALVKYRKGELQSIKESDPKELFDYYLSIEHLGLLEIFNDIKYLPKSFFGYLSHPIKSSSYNCCTVSRYRSDDFFTRDDIASNSVLRGDPSSVDNSEHPFGIALMMAIHASKAVIFDRALDKNHWVYAITKAIPDLTDFDYEDENSKSPIQVQYPEPVKSGTWNGLKVLMVEHYDLSIPDLDLHVRIDSQFGLAIGCDESACYSGQDILLMPVDSDADVLDQINDWLDNDEYDDRWARDEKGSLDAYLRVLRGQNLGSVLSDLLNDSDYTIRKALAGNTFTIAFADDGKVLISQGGSND